MRAFDHEGEVGRVDLVRHGIDEAEQLRVVLAAAGILAGVAGPEADEAHRGVVALPSVTQHVAVAQIKHAGSVRHGRAARAPAPLL
jgi:hypothetical protein